MTEGKGSEPRLGIDVRRMTAQGCAAYVRKAIAVDSLEPGESDAAAALAGAVAALASFAVVVFNLCGPEARRKLREVGVRGVNASLHSFNSTC